jgi:PhoPQ-activated pathogenicity-related protein
MKVACNLLVLLAMTALPAQSCYATALDDYIALPDGNYSYTAPAFGVLDYATGTRAFNLEMTSQAWREPNQVNTTVWTHWVTVVVPELDELFGPTKDTALILVSDGNIGEPAPNIVAPEPSQYRQLAGATRSVVVELRGVPNQPLQFADEGSGRSEDEIIAYSWDKFLRGGDSYWPVQLPMVKSVVRCMDAVEDFIDTAYGTDKTVNNFVLSGGSKRGWAAWLTAAVDTRVIGVAPIVSDLLNMQRSFAHHWSCYGFWADSLSPYEDMGIFDWFGSSSSADDLLVIVDPYEYRDRLAIPKFILTAAGDDFFLHDSIQFYVDDLLGETYVRTVPNTNHYLDGKEEQVFANMVPYYDALLTNQPRPAFSWTLNEDGSMTVTTTATPIAVNLWQADNLVDRDFRQVTIGNTWTSSVLTEQSPGVYLADPGIPLTGWRSYFVELVYDYDTSSTGIGDFDYYFTTEMRVLPEARPFEADLSRDGLTDVLDLVILAQNWLGATSYYDLMPRRTGDGIINIDEMSVVSLHWLE